MRLHCLQHVPFEGPGAVAAWAAARGYPLAVTRLYAGDPLPQLDEFDRLVVMGGPMGVHDTAEFPWLPAEKALLARALEAGRSVVGVCLGAQLLADVLGARVYRAPQREIGWLPVTCTGAGAASGLFAGLGREFTPLHWHGDTFNLPAGAVQLARSAACAQQAFLYGEGALGLQFHLETTPEGVARLVEHCADELTPGPFVQDRAELLGASAGRFRELHAGLFQLLDRLPI